MEYVQNTCSVINSIAVFQKVFYNEYQGTTMFKQGKRGRANCQKEKENKINKEIKNYIKCWRIEHKTQNSKVKRGRDTKCRNFKKKKT